VTLISILTAPRSLGEITIIVTTTTTTIPYTTMPVTTITTITTPPPSIDGKILHDAIWVDARSFKKIGFSASAGTRIELEIAWRIRVVTLPSTYNCIDVEIVRPDGSLEYVRSRICGDFRYTFTAPMSGIYTLILDNTFDDIGKLVDLAIAGFPPEKTTTIISTTTVYIPITGTSTITHTETRTVTEMITVPSPTTVTQIVTSPTTVVERVIGLTETLIIVAVVAAALVILLVLRKR